jgi:type IV secretion system protein VirD4
MSEDVKPIGFRNPFKREVLPGHMDEERIAHIKWRNRALALMLLLGIVAFLLTPVIYYSIYTAIHTGYRYETWLMTVRFFQRAMQGELVVLHLSFAQKMFTGGPFSVIGGVLFAYLICVFPAILPGGIVALLNPHTNLSHKQGYAAWADDAVLKQMEDRKQVGIEGGFLGALGRWPSGKRKGQMVQMIETLSLLCLAPPGTGKTAGLVVPTLVNSDNVSFVVNDPKPEIWEMTAAYRATVSHVFMLNWSKVDDPENGVFYPRFNFISPKLVPPPGPDRDTFIDAVARTLIPEKGKGGDSYFQDKGRAAVTGFIHYIVAKVGDAGDYTGLPERWRGHEPSIPMMADWIATNQFDATGDGGGEEVGQDDMDVDAPAGGDQGGDKLGQWLRKISTAVRPSPTNPNEKGKSERAFMELSSLVNMADKERSGVLGTMDQGLLPFKNSAVKERTSACDFTPDDMRGMMDPKTKEFKPITLYICVNQAEAQAFANITALLYEVLSRTLLSYGPNETNDKSGRKLGPHPTCLMLDEFAKLPKVEAVMTGPDLGRSKKTSYFLIAQAFGQIEKIYSKEDVSIIVSTTGVKHILAQNDPESVEKIQKMVGQTTIRDRSQSGTEGLSKQSNPLAKSISEQTSGVNFLRNEDISAIKPGKNMILAQNFMNRPMLLDTPMFFKDAEMVKKVYPMGRVAKGTHPMEPGVAHYLPSFVHEQRVREHQDRMKRIKRDNLEKEKSNQEWSMAGQDMGSVSFSPVDSVS